MSLQTLELKCMESTIESFAVARIMNRPKSENDDPKAKTTRDELKQFVSLPGAMYIGFMASSVYMFVGLLFIFIVPELYYFRVYKTFRNACRDLRTLWARCVCFHFIFALYLVGPIAGAILWFLIWSIEIEWIKFGYYKVKLTKIEIVRDISVALSAIFATTFSYNAQNPTMSTSYDFYWLAYEL